MKEHIRGLCETKYNWERSARILLEVYRTLSGRQEQ